MEWLEHIDRAILFFVNGHHSPFFDQLMWIVSGKLTWIPLYVLIAYFMYKKYRWKGVLVFALGVIVCIALADMISFRVIKNTVCRYRPSHNLEIQNQLHYFLQSNGELYKGGLYGFVSSHASNFFALCILTITVLKKDDKWLQYILFFVTLLVVYSRVYLGVHYPSDILGGAILGSVIGCFIGKLAFRLLAKKNR